MGNAGYIIDMTSDTRFVPHGKKKNCAKDTNCDEDGHF